MEAVAVEPCCGDKNPVSTKLLYQLNSYVYLLGKRNLCAFDKDMNIKSEGFIPGVCYLLFNYHQITRFPSAINIEHFLERTAAFVVIGT